MPYKDPEVQKAAKARWRENNLERHSSNVRKNTLWELYRLTPEQYETVLQYQGGVCACCGTAPTTKRLAVDHRHVDGFCRGLLCWACNYALGVAKDDPELLRAMASYLENPTTPLALGLPVYGVTGKARRKKKMVYGGPHLTPATLAKAA